MKKYFIFLILFIVSCTRSIPSLERRFMSIGMNKDQMVMNFGIPQNKYVSEDIEVWEYYEGTSSTSVSNSFNFNTFSNIKNWTTIGSGSSHLHKTRFFFKNGEVTGYVSK